MIKKYTYGTIQCGTTQRIQNTYRAQQDPPCVLQYKEGRLKKLGTRTGTGTSSPTYSLCSVVY